MFQPIFVAKQVKLDVLYLQCERAELSGNVGYK